LKLLRETIIDGGATEEAGIQTTTLFAPHNHFFTVLFFVSRRIEQLVEIQPLLIGKTFFQWRTQTN